MRGVKNARRCTDGPVVTKVDGRRRPRRRVVILTVCVVLAGLAYVATLPPLGSSVREGVGRLPSAAGLNTPTGVDPTLSAVATSLAARHTLVRCWSQTDWKGRPWGAYTATSSWEVNLSPEICAELAQLVRGGGHVWRDKYPDALAWSVEALAHEAQHVSGVVSEAEAECYGMQATPRAVRLLGRTSAEGQYLAATYWKHWYAFFKPPYSSNDCRNNGALDLHPGSDVWP